MGANMSFLRSAIADFKFPLAIHKRGIQNERTIGWYLWKKGHKTVFNKTIKTYHLLHDGDSLSRCTFARNVEQACKERELLFYYLAIENEKVSITYHLVSFFFNFLLRLRGLSASPRINSLVLKGMVKGNLAGLAMLLSYECGGRYHPSGKY
jgi:hypothetical protein